MKFYKDKFSVIISPISRSRAKAWSDVFKNQIYGPNIPLKPTITIIKTSSSSQFVFINFYICILIVYEYKYFPDIYV